MLEDISLNDINFNRQDYHLKSTFSCASFSNNVESLKMLASHKNINVNTQTKDDQTPLHYAIEMNRLELLQPLLSFEDVEVNIEDNKGNTPLQYAIDLNNVAVIKELLSHHDIHIDATDKHGHTPLHEAIESCTPKCVEALLTHKDSNTTIKDEQGRMSLEIDELFIFVASDENSSRFKQNSKRIIELLHSFESSEHQIQSNSKTTNPLTERNSTEDDRYSYTKSFIHEVVNKEDSETLKYILANNLINSNIRDNHQSTPVHYAVLNIMTIALNYYLSRRILLLMHKIT